MKETNFQYSDYIVTLCEIEEDEFTIKAWHKSQLEGETIPQVVVEGSFTNPVSAFIFIGGNIREEELK